MLNIIWLISKYTFSTLVLNSEANLQLLINDTNLLVTKTFFAIKYE